MADSVGHHRSGPPPARMTVSVTARDEGGRATTLPVPVTVYPSNRPPAARTPADRKIRIDRPARVELTSAFTDPDEGDVLTVDQR